MKNTKWIITMALLAIVGTTNAQNKLKDKLKSQMEKAQKGGEKSYDFSDETGISGTYYLSEQIIDRQNTAGFKFTKEKEGEIINQLYVELGGKGYGNRPNSMTFTLKEKYQKKFNFRHFYLTGKDCPKLANNRDEWTFTEIDTDIYAFGQNGKILCVAAKDKTGMAEYDTETAQVLYDQKMAAANTEAMEKETEKWKKNEIYSKNVGKIVFASEDFHLMKRGYMNKPPMVNGKDFKTVLNMHENMQYMAFFEFPPAQKYAGMEINVEYEMAGKKTSRTDLKGESAAWSKMVKRLETKDFDYRQHAPRALRTYNSYYGQYVQDYAFIYLIYQNKDQFKLDGEYDLTVKMYTSRDGENGDLLAEGVVKLKWTKECEKAYNGDPEKEKKGVWLHFEEFLEE